MDMERTIDAIMDCAINKVNEESEGALNLDVSNDIELIKVLDSLNVIVFVNEVEEQFQEKFNLEITLTDIEELFGEDGPLESISVFKEYLRDYVTKNAKTE